LDEVVRHRRRKRFDSPAAIVEELYGHIREVHARATFGCRDADKAIAATEIHKY
jgi:hypothetical protein